MRRLSSDSPIWAMQRILAVDYGRRRIGLAVSDPLGLTSQGLDSLVVSSREEALRRLCDLIRRWGVVEILLGLPLRTDGREGPEAQEVRDFGEKLAARSGVRVTFWDERLTSREALRALHDMGKELRDRKEEVDRISATLLLQGYLASRSPGGGKE
ncbi:MAG TPA: Holliday junction resolvase RuvX [Candidatus Latescibacteria bacterium]|nr:Holliday junction resolvase RuvX [Candidatus Latescibacterota bacterium]